MIFFSLIIPDHSCLQRHLPDMLCSAPLRSASRKMCVATSLTSTRLAAVRKGACATQVRHIHVEKRMDEKGIVLPPAPKPAANYNITCRANGNMLYISGHLPLQNDGTLMTGCAGADGIDVDQGYAAARQCGLNIVATLKNHLGDLDRVKQVVKVFGIVNSATDFKLQHKIMDGCSDVIMDIFDKPVGYHARSAIGTNTLPLDTLVEVEAIVQIKED